MLTAGARVLRRFLSGRPHWPTDTATHSATFAPTHALPNGAADASTVAATVVPTNNAAVAAANGTTHACPHNTADAATLTAAHNTADVESFNTPVIATDETDETNESAHNTTV